MGPETLARLLPILEEKIAKGKVSKESSEEARNAADSRATSRYDTQREIFARDANVQEGLNFRMEQFRDVLTAGPKDKIEVGAEFTAELWDEGDVLKDVVYSPLTVELPDLQVVVKDSPIGKAIEGMVAGNTFVYEVNGKLLAGMITEIK